MLEISKFCLSNPKKNNLVVESQHFVPPTLHKKLLGETIFLIQLAIPPNLEKNIHSLTKEVSEIIINGLKTNYYTPENLKESDNVEIVLENALQKVNRLISQEIIGSKIFEKLVRNLNAIVAVIKEEKIYFSPVGLMQAFILRKDKMLPLYQPAEKSYQTSFKTFTQIISGSLEKNDLLIFATDNFLDYFNFEKLRDCLFKSPMAMAMKNLERSLENLKEEISIGVFLIKKEKERKTKEIATLVTEEKEKPKILTEEIKPVSVPTKIIVQSTKEEVKEIFIHGNKKEEPFKKPEKKPSLKLPKISLSFFPPIFNAFLSLFKQMPRPKIKFTSFLLTILIVMMILNFLHLVNRDRINPKFFQTFQEVQEKITLLKASLIYADQKNALTLAKEIEDKIIFLKPKSVWEKEIFNNLKNNFEESLEKLYKIEKIAEPKIVTSLSSLDKNGQFENFSFQNNKFFVFNKRLKEIYDFDQKIGRASSLVKLDLSLQKFLNYTTDELILLAGNKIYLFNQRNKKISPLKLETKQKELSISDLEIYDHKLYILDQKNNQIFKYLKLEEGFGQESNWLKEKVDLKNIVSLTIDGSIYLLKENGEILKFYLGRKSKFDQERVYPEIKKVTKILTQPDFKYIYLLEPENKRIVLLDKNGKLIKQITSEKFTDLKDLFVDEKETKIWLLNRSQIVEIEL
ncbi:MAG: hypothetical protein N2259_02375 [Patescibacteria group bacterium]|nr:hypothetical protein [Patescibacteria group bacterium]